MSQDAPARNPPPSAGEGAPGAGGRGERQSRLATIDANAPEAGFPSPDPLRGPPSPAEGGGSAQRAHASSSARQSPDLPPSFDNNRMPSIRMPRSAAFTMS
ncbi:hypothetical protein JCM2811A_17780 [Methylorubrum rhodinum]